MHTSNQKLVVFLESMMYCGCQIKNDQPVIKDDIIKDATEEEMQRHCKQYPCNGCPIFDRCGMAVKIFGR